MEDYQLEALMYSLVGVMLLFYALYKSKMFAHVTSNQLLALGVTIAGAVVYWYYLMLLTMEKIEVGAIQIAGLAFAVCGAFIAWLRFILTTAGHTG